MPKTITRPKRAATLDESTATDAEQPHAPADWRDLVAEAREKGVALIQSVVTAEDHGVDVEVFWRLSGLARQTLDEIVIDEMSDVEWAVNDAMALLHAAISLPGETPQKSSVQVLKVAHEILGTLAHCFSISGVPGTEEVAAFRQAAAVATVSLSGLPADKVITRDSELPRGGKHALDLALTCTYDLDAIGCAIVAAAEDAEIPLAKASMLRTFGSRVVRLNGVLPAYLGEDTVTLRDAHREIYEGAFELPEGALQ